MSTSLTASRKRDLLKQGFTQSDIKMLEIQLDPVLWAEKYLRDPSDPTKPLFIRKYQKDMLRCQDDKKVYRCGRRIGKCRKINDLQTLVDGRRIPYSQLLSEYNEGKKNSILTFDTTSQTISSTDEFEVWSNGIKPTIELTTETGRRESSSKNHPYLIIKDGMFKWVDLSDLKIGDKIACPGSIDVTGTKSISEDLAYLFGYLQGDGGTTHSVIFTNADKDVIDHYKSLALKFGATGFNERYERNCYIIRARDDKHKLENRLKELLELYDLFGKKSVHKTVPEAIYTAPKHEVRAFIAALYECDGWVSISSIVDGRKSPTVQIGYCSSSYDLASGVKHLLLRFGIVARLKKKKTSCNGKQFFTYQVTINDNVNIIKFIDKIDFAVSKKKETAKIREILADKNYCDNSTLYTIPKEIYSKIKSVQKEKNMSTYDVIGATSRDDAQRLRSCYAFSRQKLETYANNLDNDFLKKLATNDIVWEKIISLKDGGEHETVDLHVPGTHTFIGNDIISHNSIVLCLEMIWKAYNNKDKTILVCAPYKCIAEGSNVQMSNGSLKYIEQIEIGDHVATPNGHAKVIEISNDGIQDVFQINTDCGRVIEVTDTHRFPTTSGLKTIHEFNDNDKLMIPSQLPVGNGVDMTDEELKVLCYIIADGTCTKDIRFCNNEDILIDDFITSCETMDDKLHYHTTIRNNCTHVRPTRERGCKTHVLYDLIDRCEIRGLNSHKKFIHKDIINNANEEQLGLVLGILWSCDGHVSHRTDKRHRGCELIYTTVSEQLAENVQTCLLKLGLFSTVRFYNNQYSGYYKVSVCDDVDRFAKYVKLIGEKRIKINTVTGKGYGTKSYKYKRVDGNIATPITSIAHIGRSNVYDIEIDSDEHLFICEGIITHNSQIQSLWKDGLEKLIKGNALIENSITAIRQNPYTIQFANGSRILGLTAGAKTGNKGGSIRGQSASDLYLDEVDYMGEEAIQSIMAIIATSSNTKFVISSTPTGRREFFYNCCINKTLGYTEFHYPSSDSPEWMSIEEAKAAGLPLHKSQEYIFRNSNPEHVYRKEYDATFGDEAEGVFKHSHIDPSIIIYDTKKEKYDPKGRFWWCGYEQNKDNVYALGVDWNGEKNGTQLVIVEYLKNETDIEYMDEVLGDDGIISYNRQHEVIQGKYRVYYRESVSVKDMTQLASIKKIIDLNKRFKIDHMYLDAGYGSTNLEELKLYGMNFPESELNKKIKSIDFSSSVHVYDPFTKERIKKPIKPFMVYNTQTCLERGELILPSHEDERVFLVGQMREYRIESVSALGNPKFSSENDHVLDAFMLAMLAFQMEYSELVKVHYSEQVAFSKKPMGLIAGVGSMTDRNLEDEDTSPLAGVPKRLPALNADNYHQKSPTAQNSSFDFEDVLKNVPKTGNPFSTTIHKTGWSRVGSPSRSTF